tara:strand:+ start:2912 stop:4201 length:1290 start_codon:yes stop_codon:yes gene_type:complete
MKNNSLIKFLFFSILVSSLYAEEDIKATNHLDSIVLGSGCFWGAEKGYESLLGVEEAISGYSDGRGVRPVYREIIKFKNKFNPNNHAEVVKVIFNKNLISTERIIKKYFESHDPTQLNRQGNDIGTQYRSIILVRNDEQKQIAENLLSEFQSLLSLEGYGEIKTEIKTLEKFYEAEEYHQDYLVKNPNGYCPDLSTGVVFEDKNNQLEINNNDLYAGKHILVIESEFCPYCKKLREDVLDSYKGSIPLSYRKANQLEGLKISTPLWATPTIIFLENGKEILSNQGYLTKIEFYRALGFFKLGNSEAFNVAFNEGTDSRYCKEYELFKNTPEGQFIDKLSGEPLFDTKDRFNSKTGWLSFTRPIKGSVYELPDYSYGMIRTEVRSKSSDIHLGHVFDDGPNGLPRYCINATVLEFVPKINPKNTSNSPSA